MGSTLTGSTVASTYQSLLKVSDNSSLTSTLKTVTDGSGVEGGLQLSTTDLNAAPSGGNFTVNTNKFTVAGSSGNTLVAGTLNSAGTFTVNTNKFSVLASSGNSTIAGTLTVNGNVSLGADLTTNNRIVLNGNYGVNQNSSAASNSFAGSTTFTGLASFIGGIQVQSAVNLTDNLTVAGVTTLNGNVVLGNAAGDTITVNGTPTFAQEATFTGAANFNGNVVLGNTAFDTVTVNAVSTFSGNASFNGNTTIGSDETDTLTVNAAFNPSTVTYDAADFVLIQDASDYNKIKKATVSSVFGKRYKSAEFSIPEYNEITNPSANYDLILDEEHGLGGVPDVVQVFLICKTSVGGYSVGDMVPINAIWSGSYSPAFSESASASKITVYRSTFNGQMSVKNKDESGNETLINNNPGYWRVIATAIRFN